MDLLRNLFGNVAAGIIRLLVAVGILAAAYFFIVKPTLDAGKEISHEVNVNVHRSLSEANLGDVSKTIDDVNRQVRVLRRPASDPAVAELVAAAADEAANRYGSEEARRFPVDPLAKFVLATVDGVGAGCGAIQPIDDQTVELQRMNVR